MNPVNTALDVLSLTRLRFSQTGHVLLNIAPQFAVYAARLVQDALRKAKNRLNVIAVITPTYDHATEALATEARNRAAFNLESNGPGDAAPTIWGSLGEIEFDLSASPDTFSGTDGVNYASHPLIGGKPRLQYTGSKLQTAKLAINWHCVTTPDLQERFEALLKAMRDREVLELVIGKSTEGSAYAGEYVITNISHTVTKHNPDGSLMALNLTVDLQEWVEPLGLEVSLASKGDSPKGVIPKNGPTPTQKEQVKKDDEGYFLDAQGNRSKK